MSKKTIIGFDLYGTLLSTESIADQLAKEYGQDIASTLAANWRRYQLEYTWRLNSMGTYHPFDQVTRASLHHALAEAGLKATPEQETSLMESYNRLHFFPDASAGLHLVSAVQHIDACIFSNGTLSMITASMSSLSSQESSSGASVLERFITVEDVQVFKPDKRTYQHLLKQYGKEENPGDVWLISSNPFDVVGAVAAGLKAAWVDRSGKGWVDNLGDTIGDIKPTVVASGVADAVTKISSQTYSQSPEEGRRGQA